MIRAAADARVNSYAPYSKFAVGSAVRTRSGRIYVGVNMENVSYGVTICAEVGALAAAAAGGDLGDVESIAVVGSSVEPTTPCGRCRQLILEASRLTGVDVIVHSCNTDLSRVETLPISALLPNAFSVGQLKR